MQHCSLRSSWSLFWFGCAAIMFGLACATIVEPARAETTVAFTSFDQSLGPYGSWVDDPVYGRVWRPSDTRADWQPYTYGHWAYTREYGWIWVSDEPWGLVSPH